MRAVLAAIRLSTGTGLLLVATSAPLRAQWTPDGIPVCAAERSQAETRAVSDEAGGAIVAWADLRHGNWDVFLQRVNDAGSVLWPANGVPICTVRGDQDPLAMISDGAGGAIVVWHDYRCGSALYAQRVGASGQALWAPGGVPLSSSSGYQIDPRCASDGASGLIAVWGDSHGGTYAQRIDANGQARWGAAGVAVTGGANAALDSDGLGGAIVAFTNYGTPSIGAQRVDATGALLWPGGVTVCYTGTGADQASVVSDGAGGAVIAWTDGRAGNYPHVFAQRLGPTGVPSWTTNGISLCSADRGQHSPKAVSDGAHGALVVWVDDRSGSGSDLYARRISASGDTLWQTYGVPVCMAAGTQTSPSVVSDGAGGAIVAWQDGRGADWDVFAQRFDGSGAMQWAANGVALCTRAGDQTSPAIVADRRGGGIAAWNDARVSISDVDVFAQHVDELGSAGGAVGVAPDRPGAFRVLPAVPNPSDGRVTVAFDLPAGAEVSVDVLDPTGRRVRSLATRQHLLAGPHRLDWDERAGGGTPVPAGLYFVRVRAGDAEGRSKVVICR